ncbi:hypothetical protein OH492_00465 [Vibrio chagasii]|nr:hypothetical protein [Vibrio chagasii]
MRAHYGRRLHLPEINRVMVCVVRQPQACAAINAPMQGTAADIIESDVVG